MLYDSKLIRSQVPDKAAHTMPPDLTSGTYRVLDLTDTAAGGLYEGKVILDKTYGHAAYGCAVCCGPKNALMGINPMPIPVYGSGDQSVLGNDSCSGQLIDITDDFPTWWTDNTSIATANGRHIYGVAAGTANNLAQSVPMYWGNAKYYSSCPQSQKTPTGPVAVKPTITGPNTVWWFAGQQAVSGYSTSITLTSSGGNGTIWAVIAGAPEVNISPTGSTVTVTSSGSSFSSSVGDVQITAQANFEASAPFHLTTRTPHGLANKQVLPSCNAGYGYQDAISYNIQDQLLVNVPSALPWNEEWTSSIVDDDAPQDNWSLFGQPIEEGATGTILVDYITGVWVNNTPAPNPTPVCSGTPVKVQHWGQEFRVGSSTTGLGQPVQTDTFVRFNEHAEHD